MVVGAMGHDVYECDTNTRHTPYTHTRHSLSPDRRLSAEFLHEKDKFFTYLFFLLTHYHFKYSICIVFKKQTNKQTDVLF